MLIPFELTLVTGIAIAGCVLCASALLALLNQPMRWSTLAIAAGLAFVVILNEALRHGAQVILLVAVTLALCALIAGLTLVIDWIAAALSRQSGTIQPTPIQKQTQPL